LILVGHDMAEITEKNRPFCILHSYIAAKGTISRSFGHFLVFEARRMPYFMGLRAAGCVHRRFWE
jgi:hypothetical protein